MLRLSLKLFILCLLGLAVVNKNYVQSTKLKIGQETPNINMDLDKLKELEKSEVPDDSKKSSEQEDLVKSLSSISGDDLTQVKLEDLKEMEKEDSSKFEGQSCENIKKLGQQKNYCESKFLLSQGEEKTVECMKSFCPVCCQGELECQEKCRKTHAFFTDHDPEEMFISVCSYKDMGPSFEGFCKSMLTESDPSEYNQCITNFCFDCCSNELKINDFNDPEMVKCLGVCKPPEKIEDSSPVPGTLAPATEKEDAPNQMKLENKILELNNQGDQVDEHKDDQQTEAQSKSESSTVVQDTDNYKVLVDFSKGKKEIKNQEDKITEINQISSEEKNDQLEFNINSNNTLIEKTKEKNSDDFQNIISSQEKVSLETKENNKKTSNTLIKGKDPINNKNHSKDEYEESKLPKLSKQSKHPFNYHKSIDEIKFKGLDKITEISNNESKDFAENENSKNLENLKYTPEERNRRNIIY